MGQGFLNTDRSIKPKDMVVGDIIVGHHESNPALSIPEIVAQGRASRFVGPHTVTKILIKPDGINGEGVYYRAEAGKQMRYVEWEPNERLWIIVRDRPGIPKFIEEYPGRCVKCNGRVYVGLDRVVHERGTCVA